MAGKRDETYLRYSSKAQSFRKLFSKSLGVTPSSSAAEIRTFILADRYLKDAYEEMYSALRVALPISLEGLVIEVGAGSGIGKTWIPEMYCSDLRVEPSLDIVFDGTRMPFADQSVRAFVLKDSLHHVADIEQFLNEAARCLKVGGMIVACEPYWGLVAKFIYKYFHPEPFDKKQLSWTVASHDAWDSNQALPWIILRRDAKQLSTDWSELELFEYGPILGPSYLLSGGLFGRTMIPSAVLVKMRRREEKLGGWFNFFRFEFVFSMTKKQIIKEPLQEKIEIGQQ